MRNITNLRAISDQPDMLHLFSFKPVAIGTVEEIEGKKYQVINNSTTTIVSYAPVEDWVQNLKDYREFMQWDEDEPTDYTGMTQEDAKKALIEDLEFIIGTNGVGELFDTELHYCDLLGLDLSDYDPPVSKHISQP